jgi:uroporphyrinogen decarboxylase
MVFEHKEPDRIPIDFGGVPPASISAIAYNKLCKYLNIRCECKMMDLLQQVAHIDEAVRERFHVDFKGIFPQVDTWREEKLVDGSICQVPDSWRPVTLPDGSKIVYDGDTVVFKMPPDGWYYDHAYWPLQDATIEDLDSFVWPAPYAFYKLPDVNNLDIYLNGVEEEAKYWYENSEYALVGSFGGSIYEAATGLMGYEKFFTDIIANRKFVEKLFDKLVNVNLEYAKRYLDKVADYIDVIMVGGEDIGAQDRLEIHPDMYREIVKPRQKALWDYIKKNSRAYLLVHSCGAISDIIEDYIEIGVDAINPVQVSGTNMDSKYLKEKFGDRIVFWGGGCDTQRVLPFGSPEDVEAEVKKRIKDFAPGGGFVFNQVHNIQYNVSPENITRMFDSANKYGKYPINL